MQAANANQKERRGRGTRKVESEHGTPSCHNIYVSAARFTESATGTDRWQQRHASASEKNGVCIRRPGERSCGIERGREVWSHQGRGRRAWLSCVNEAKLPGDPQRYATAHLDSLSLNYPSDTQPAKRTIVVYTRLDEGRRPASRRDGRALATASTWKKGGASCRCSTR